MTALVVENLASSPMGEVQSSDTALTRIKELHLEVLGLAKTTLKKAIKIGEILSRQKRELGHGNWLPWVNRLPFSYKTAERYMAVFENRLKLDTVSNLSEAYRLLAPPAEDRANWHGAKAELATLEDRIRGKLDQFLETAIALLEFQQSTSPERFREFLGDDHDQVLVYLEIAQIWATDPATGIEMLMREGKK